MNGARQSGFTLIEVMAAVLILAMALGAIIAGFAHQANLSSELRDRTLALMVARNELAQITLDVNFPDTGERDGEAEFADDEWEWEAVISETEDPALRRVEVLVRRRDDERELATLTGFVANTGRQQ